MRRLIRKLCFAIVCAALPALSQKVVIRAPSSVSAGSSLAISTTGSGSATLYLIGPSHVRKQSIKLGHDVEISGQDLAVSGTYQAVTCDSEGCVNTAFQVLPENPARLAFLLHPSRVPVSTPKAV